MHWSRTAVERARRHCTADGYGPERTVDSQSLGWPQFLLLRTVDTNHRADHDWASLQAGVGRRFAFQVAAPSRLFHITADRGSRCISFNPCPTASGVFSLVESRPAGVQGKKRASESRGEREPCLLLRLATKDCVAPALPARGMNGCGPTALVRPGQGSPPSKRDPCEGGKGSERAAGPSCLL